MNKVSSIHSLKYRMVIALGISLMIALGVYILFNAVSNYLISTYYLSETAIRQRTGEYAERLADYVQENEVYSGDFDKLQKWVRQNPYSYMTLYDKNGMIWESGWWDDTVETLTAASSPELFAFETTIDQEDTAVLMEPNYFDSLYDIPFMDGTFWVSVTDFSDENLYNMSRSAITVFSIFLVFPIVLIYARKISKRVIQLTNEVDVISSGTLDGKITIRGQDEIAQLADGVNIMRLSVIEQLEKEQIAWRANSDLITSMSHDIRTPLTVLLGYTSLIKNKQYSSTEEFDSYVDVIEKKSLQLKELSDKLFRYFLVFGNSGKTQLEPVKASEVLPSLIGEHTVLLCDNGFHFDSQLWGTDCMLQLDLSYTKRLFDNIFSNIEKYADPQKPCKIVSALTQDQFTLSISNAILPEPNEVEKTRIGLKTCQRIAEHLNGTFQTESKDGLFTVVLNLPAQNCPEPPTEKAQA